MAAKVTSADTILILSGGNFNHWKFQLTLALEEHDLAGVVTGLEPRPVDDKLVDAWKKKDLKARRIISGSLNETQLEYVFNCSTVKPLSNYKQLKKWNHLRDVDFPEPLKKTPSIVIGEDYAALLMAREVRKGPANAPVASLTAFGWVVHGRKGNLSQSGTSEMSMVMVEHIDPDESPKEQVREQFRLEAKGVGICKKLEKIRQEDVLLSRFLWRGERRVRPFHVFTMYDSRNVLCWLKAEDPGKFKMYITHRTDEILEVTEVSNWRWVPKADNVADDATRNATPADMSSASRWVTGQSFILAPDAEWPQVNHWTEVNFEELGLKRKCCLLDWMRLLITNRSSGHHGMEFICNEIRQWYWIPGLKLAEKKVTRECTQYRLEKAKQSVPEMTALLEVRLFNYVGVDYFGPIEVVNGRKREKSRGNLIRMWSGNITNFQGADRELQRALSELLEDVVGGNLANQGIKWNFIPPEAPHMGGAWERLVRSVKTAMRTIFGNRTLIDSLLATFLVEAEAMVNSRPLTTVSSDLDDSEAITPNCFLFGSTSVQQLPGVFPDGDLSLRKRWRHAQVLSNHFWSSWLKEYLPSLALRGKWNKNTPDIKVGELVFVADQTEQRNHWTKGVVDAVFPGKDGRVRVVDIRTAGCVLRRPLAKLLRIQDWPVTGDSMQNHWVGNVKASLVILFQP